MTWHSVRLSLLLVTLTGAAQAYYPPYGQQPGTYPAPYSPGGAQAAPYWHPSPTATRPSPANQPPRIETSLSDATPYEQQSLVFSVRIVSETPLERVMSVATAGDDLVLRALGDPVTRRDPQDKSRLTLDYRYLVMPLTSGLIEIPPVRISGNYATGGAAAFEVSGNKTPLQVRPANDTVRPWLPLYALQITARVRGGEAPAVGNPIEMDVETRAVGTTGAQIPSVGALLESKDFHVYAGSTETEGQVSADGTRLEGRRVEHFTLVPRYGGWLNLPGVSLNWWNVKYNRPEVATLLTDQIHVMGPPRPAAGSGAERGALGATFFWLPMGLAIGLLMFGWLSAFLGDGRLPGAASFGRWLRPLLGELYAPLQAFATRFSPRRRLHRLRTWTGRHLPVSWKLWFCLRALAREDDPAEWAQALQILAAKHLGARPHAHLRELGKVIARCHPRANALQLDKLLTALDRAVYGTQPMASFARWKHDFQRQIKPGLLPLRLHQRVEAGAGAPSLPDLNPQ